MRNRRFEAQMSSRESVNQQLEDSGVDMLEGAHEYELSMGSKEELNGQINQLRLEYLADPQSNDLSFTEPDFRDPDEVQKEFIEAKTSKDRLTILGNLHVENLIDLAPLLNEGEGQRYFQQRLYFYEQRVQGKAVEKYINIEGKEVVEKIPKTDVKFKDVVEGIRRDALYAEMLGTPELAMLEQAQDMLGAESEPWEKPFAWKLLKGNLLHTRYGDKDNIGAYGFLLETYQKALHEAKKNTHGKKNPEDVAIKLGAQWVQKAYEYRGNHPMGWYGSHNPKELTEAVAWARLSPGLQRKILHRSIVDEHAKFPGLDRFVETGKDSKYAQEMDKLSELREELAILHLNTGQRIAGFDEKTEEYRADIRELEEGNQNERLVWYGTKENAINNYKKNISQLEYNRGMVLEEAYGQMRKLLSKEGQEDLGKPSLDQTLEELDRRIASLHKKYQKTKSIGEKALDLAEMDRDDEGNWNYDWVNRVPFRVIRLTHNALQRGVSQETAFAYANVLRLIGPEVVVTREMVSAAKELTTRQYNNVEQIHSAYMSGKITGESPSLDGLLRLKEYTLNTLVRRLNQGYTITTLIKHPWLSGSEFDTYDDLFPFDKKVGQQQGWCLKHAQYIPEGWQRKPLGSLVLNRLEAGVDNTLHNATHWLEKFEVPVSDSRGVYKDLDAEVDLLFSITDVPTDKQSRIPQKPRRFAEMFSSPAAQFIYQEILPLVAQKPSFDMIAKAVGDKLQAVKQVDPRRYKGPNIETLETEVPQILEKLKVKMAGAKERTPYSLLVQRLKNVGAERKKYRVDAQRWVVANGMTPSSILTYAWANRADALADGCEDNPRAIRQWAKLNGLQHAFTKMEQSGQLPKNVTKADLLAKRNVLNELVRCYDGKTTIKAVARLKERLNTEYTIPPMKLDLGNGWHGEVLEKTDPRGFTIGHDTGCCMTLGGASESCIRAGYEKPDYGFFALYRDGNLVAQSFIYSNDKKDPSTIVCDNIEANKGRDMGAVTNKYQQFWNKYLHILMRRNPNNTFSKVHIGEGYTEVGLGHLPEAEPLPMKKTRIYTDAHKQRELLHISAEEQERLGKLKASVFQGSWRDIRNDVMKIEAQAFEGKGYSEGHLQSDFENPENIVLVYKDGDRVVGYSTALPEDNDTLHISSTAFLSSHQGKGYVSDIMHMMDVVARMRGYSKYTRDARVDNGYADKLKRQYDVTKMGEVYSSPYGRQQYLEMVIPDHKITKELEAVLPLPKPETKVETAPVHSEQAAIMAQLEQDIYPKALRQGEEFFEEELEGVEPEDNASFLIYEKGNAGQEPVGYVLAYTEDSEVAEGKVLYVADAAIVPEKQRQGIGKELFQKLVAFARSRQEMPIEFHARSTTSYQAIMASGPLLEGLGYRIVADELYENYFAEEEGEPGEDVHFIRLERIERKKIAA